MVSVLFSVVVALTAAVPCGSLRATQPVAGRLLVTAGDADDVAGRKVLCVVDQAGVYELAPPPGYVAGGAAWAGTADRAVVSTCRGDAGSEAFCPAVVLSLDGRVVSQYPAAPTPALTDADGRVSPWRVEHARVSPDGALMVASVGGVFRIVRLDGGGVVQTLPAGVCEAVWSPDGASLAYTQDPSARDMCLNERQLFRYELASGTATQLSHFLPVDLRPWWNPFARPVVRRPRVAHVSWARQAPVVAFHVVPGEEVFLWTPRGEEIGRIAALRGECWRATRVAADGQQLVYVSATRPGLCLVNGGDEVRRVGVRGQDDVVVLRTADPSIVITDVDW